MGRNNKKIDFLQQNWRKRSWKTLKWRSIKDIDFTLSPNQLDDVPTLIETKWKESSPTCWKRPQIYWKRKNWIQIWTLPTKFQLFWIYHFDTGVGISTEEQGKIFNKFYQSETISEENIWIALDLAHKGIYRKWARTSSKSEPGKGSEFSFILPRPQQNTSSKSIGKWQDYGSTVIGISIVFLIIFLDYILLPKKPFKKK